MARKRIYFPDKRIEIDPKWLPERYRGKLKSSSFSPFGEERLILKRPGSKLTISQIDLFVSVIHALLDKLDGADREDLKELSHAVRFKLGGGCINHPSPSIISTFPSQKGGCSMAEKVRFDVAILRDPSTGTAQGFQLIDIKRHGVEAMVTPGGDLIVDVPEAKLEMLEATLWALATAFSGRPLEQSPDIGSDNGSGR